MAAFKDGLDEAAVRSSAACVLAAWPEFDAEGFIEAAASGLESRELKERVAWIAEQYREFLPKDFEKAIKILVSALGPAGPKSGDEAWGSNTPDAITGFRAWPVSFFVGAYGLDHPEASLDALAEITRRFTGEFAIRHFLLRDPERTLARMHAWAQSDDQHLRRLASEGSRPRLPWGVQLKPFIADPRPVFALLERLKHDPEESVRRSVANNLNDIARDNPDQVLDLLQRWQAEGGLHPRLVPHACRTLIKQGEPRALRLQGYAVPPQLEVARFELAERSLRLGDTMQLETELRSRGSAPQKLAIDYVLDLVGAKGKRREKVFKGSVRTLKPGAVLTVRWKKGLTEISTRRYYDGPHSLQLLINGERLARADFELSGC